MFKKVNADLQKAMKEKDNLRLETLRMMKSKILNVNARGDLPETEIIKILTKYAKSLEDTIEETKKVNRPEAVEKLDKELAIVREYLPKQLSADEVKKAVEEAIAASGATSIKDMGKVMKEVLAKHPGIDGKMVNQFVREKLGS